MELEELKMRRHQYKEEYARSYKSKNVEWDKIGDNEQIWEQVKWPMVDSAKEVCSSVRVGI